MKRLLIAAVTAATAVCPSCTDREGLDGQSVPLQVSVTDGDGARAAVTGTQLGQGARLGVSLRAADGSAYEGLTTACTNVPYVSEILTGGGNPLTWTSAAPIPLSPAEGKAVAYYPYSSTVTDIRAVPVETASQTDYMYSDWATGVSAMRPQAGFTMHHALTSIQVDIVNGSYLSASKPGRVTSVSVASSQLATAASLDITTAAGDAAHGGLSAFQGAGTDIAAAAGFNISSVPHSTRILAVPMGGKADLSVRVAMDGKIYTVPVTAVPEPFRQGRNYVVTLTAKAGENPFDVSDVAVKPWNAMSLGNVMASKDYGPNQYVVKVRIPYNNYEYTHNTFKFTGTIDWGDGKSMDYYTATNSSHVYRKSGEYVVTATGKCEALGKVDGVGGSWSNLISDIIYIGGGMGIKSVQRAFGSSIELKFIRKGIFDNLTEITDFRETFSNCDSLKSIPAGLFDKCTKVTDFYETFWNCDSLKSIPARLFDKCTKVTNFRGTFDFCTNLQSIPAGLFDKCTQVTSFSQTFWRCLRLESIPAGLFDHCTKAGFQQTFKDCHSLQSIPTGLFDKCTKVTDFRETFDGCSALKGVSPYTEIVTADGSKVKVHLYERENYPDWFAKPDGKSCFRECTGLSDYSQIPGYWSYYSH